MSTSEERIARLEAQVARLLEIVAEKDAKIAKLEARIAEFEGRASQNSSNSNKPPSTDPPGSRPGKTPTGRSRGGQPGHKPYKRVMLPPTRVTDSRPTACACCGGRHLEALGTPPRLHQVLDVPQPAPDVHEIRMHGARCVGCGETTWGSLPEGVPAHMFGPRLLGLIAYLASARMSRRQLRELLLEVFGIPVSLGALSEAEERASRAMAPAVDAAIEHVRGRHVKHVDGSSWRIRGVLAPVWTIATKLVTVFFITSDGTAKTVKSLLGSLAGFLVTDRGTQFGFWAMHRRQVCWAHLVRKFVSFSERKDEGAALGQHLLLFSQAMLSEWHRVRDGTMTRAEFAQRVDDYYSVAITNLLAQGVELRLRGVSGACEDALEHREALFSFARIPGVDPTNNHAERALRPFVLWRKTSQGSQSERGCLFASRVMTVAQTRRQQKASVFDFLVDACRSAQQGTLMPSLLPATR